MRKADNVPSPCAVVTKFGNLKFLEPSGPEQGYNGTDLPLPFITNSEFVSITLVIQHTHRMRRIIVFSVACLTVQYFSTFHQRHDFRGEKKIIEHKIPYILESNPH